MDLLAAFAVFIISMVTVIFLDYSTVIAIVIGLIAFVLVAIKRGFTINDLIPEAMSSVKDSILVVEVMAVIGFLTAAWRISGTIIIFVYYGMEIITPKLFLLVAFLLSSLLSYAIGTSFGVAGTVGVIFMALARSGGVNPIITAGIIMSGVFFGDRCSPVSSSANLVAGVTKTDIYENVKLMLKTGALPFIISLAVYTLLSINNPLAGVDEEMMEAFRQDTNLSLWCFIPAIIMLVLPFLKVRVIHAMGISIAAAVIIAIFIQGESVPEIIRTLFLGYQRMETETDAILQGGGLVSMVSVILILLISSMYSGIFKKTNMLKSIQDYLIKLSSSIGRFPACILTGAALAMVFCNQTIGILMTKDMMEKAYEETAGGRSEFAIDMENSVVLISCIIPWCIGCMVPLRMLGVGVGALPFAVYMYGVPLCYLFTKKFFKKEMI